MATKNLSQPIIFIAENTSSVESGEVELFDVERLLDGDLSTGTTEISTEKWKNTEALTIQQSETLYSGNPYMSFDMGDEGENFVVGKEANLMVGGSRKKGIVREYEDGSGNTIKGFGNPFLYNQSYEDNGLDYFCFYEGTEPTTSQYISGKINDGASTFTFYINEQEVVANVNGDGTWRYNIPNDVVITSLKTAFRQNINLISVDLSHIDTSECTNMEQMFFKNNYLESIDLTNMNTQKVENMRDMFYWCNRLKSLDLSSFDMSNVTNVSYSFYWENELETLSLSENFITNKVNNMNGLFVGVKGDIDVTDFDTSNVTSMYETFNQVRGNIIGLSSFDTGKVTDMRKMFWGCQSETLDLSSFDTSKVTKMNSMFTNCKVKNLDLSSFDTRNVTEFDDFVTNSNEYTITYHSSIWNNAIVEAFPNVNWNDLDAVNGIIQ